MTTRPSPTPEAEPEAGAAGGGDREAIAFVLRQRPGPTEAHLRATLARLGVVLERDALLAHLAALGHEVVDVDGTPTVLPEGDRPAPAGATGDGVGGPRSEAPRAPRRGPPSPSSLAVASAVSIVVLLVAILAGVAVDRRGDEEAVQTPTGVGGRPVGEEDPAAVPVERDGGVDYAPSGEGSDPALAGDDVAREDFGRDGPDLGVAPGERPWTVQRGDWTLADGVASVSGGDPGGLNLATIDVGSTDVRAQVTLAGGEPGSGLAFRVVDADTYWLLASLPEYATFALVRVEDGVATAGVNTGVTSTTAGAVIGVNAQGSTIELLVDGAVAETVEDPDPQGTAVGLGTGPDQTEASFEELLVLA